MLQQYLDKNLFHPEQYQYVPKGWGYEIVMVNNEMYCGKILFVRKGCKFSWHYHIKKDEFFYIQEGEAQLTFGFVDDITDSKTIILCKSDGFHIEPYVRHQVLALQDTSIFEFSTKHSDEDSIRVIKGD